MHCFYFNKYWSISVYNFDSTVSHCVKFDKCNLEVLYICSLFTFNKYWSISVYNFDSTISHYVKFDRCNLKVLHSWRVYNFNKYWYWSISLYNFYSTISHYVKFDRCNLKVLHSFRVFTSNKTEDLWLCTRSTRLQDSICVDIMVHQTLPSAQKPHCFMFCTKRLNFKT